MKYNKLALLLSSSCAAVSPLTGAVLFSNDFEDNDFAPEIGTWAFTNTPTTGVIATAVPGDATLGDRVGLIDQGTGNLGLNLTLTGAGSLAIGAAVTIDFDFAARRTTGNSKTIFVDALDAGGDIVTRLVLGDSGAFGNGGNDRQRPGYDPTSAGAANTANTLFPAPSTPGSFWWGSDGNTVTFDVVRDAHLSLTISASTFDFSSTRAAGASYSTTGLNNRDSGTFTEVASVRFTSAGANHGFYIDNLIVESVPEPSSFALLALSSLGLLRRRRA